MTVAVCPEFLREGTGIADFLSPPFTVIGASDLRAIDTVSRLFAFLDAPLRVVHPRTAEALKYACNAFHATKVSFANELGRILSRLGVDSREVMEIFCEDTALNISPKYLRPGFAFGGSCLPKDLRSLLYLARAESIDVPLLSGALASNRLTIDEASQPCPRQRGAPGRPARFDLQAWERRSPRESLRRSGRDPAREGVRGAHLRPRPQPFVSGRHESSVRGVQAPAPQADPYRRTRGSHPGCRHCHCVQHDAGGDGGSPGLSPCEDHRSCPVASGPEIEALECYEGFAW